MDLNTINQELTTLREQIKGRASLLQEYATITNQLTSLPKRKENYEAILALTEKQESVLLKLKENKKLGETYLQKIEEKAELLKKADPSLAAKLLVLETAMVEQEAIRVQVSESIMVATTLLNELGKLNRQGGKARVWGIGDLFGSIIGPNKKRENLKEAKRIVTNIRRLTRRYKEELKEIDITELPNLSVNGFLGVLDHFLNDSLLEIIIQVEIWKLLKKTRAFEALLVEQLEKLEEKETALETKVNDLKRQKNQWIEKV